LEEPAASIFRHSTTSQKTVLLIVCAVTASELSKLILAMSLETKSEGKIGL
jgi:hypothetical protein